MNLSGAIDCASSGLVLATYDAGCSFHIYCYPEHIQAVSAQPGGQNINKVSTQARRDAIWVLPIYEGGETSDAGIGVKLGGKRLWKRFVEL